MRLFTSDKVIFLGIILLISNFYFGTAGADFAPTLEEWHYMIDPYGWLASVRGTLSVDGTRHNFNIPFSELIKNLDGGAELHMEGGYGPWSLMVDPTYLKLTMDKKIGRVDTSLTSKTLLTDMGLFYQLVGINLPREQYLSFEILGGGRDLDVNNYFHAGKDFSASSGAQFFAPIVGARIKYMLTHKMEFWLRGDVGGFSIDHMTNTWSSTLGFGYSASKHIDLGVAYRVLQININEANSSIRTLFHGPMIGISFHG